MSIILKKLWGMACNLLHWVSPALLSASLALGWYSLSLRDDKAQLEGSQEVLEAASKADNEILPENQKAKRKNADRACKSVQVIREAATDCPVSPECPKIPHLLQQELPEDLLKAVDPTYDPPKKDDEEPNAGTGIDRMDLDRLPFIG